MPEMLSGIVADLRPYELEESNFDILDLTDLISAELTSDSSLQELMDNWDSVLCRMERPQAAGPGAGASAPAPTVESTGD